MAIQQNFPNIAPTLNLSFALTKALDPRITFTRASTATYYDGVTTAMAEQNLLLQSQDFTTSWTTDNASITSNSGVSPDGTTTAEKLVPANTVDLTNIGNGAIRQSPSFASGSTFTYSVFAKADGFNRVELYFSEGTGTTNRASVVYSLVDGTVVTAAAVAGTFTNVSSTSTSVGNSWYRFTLTFTAGTATTARARIAARDSVSSTGNGTDGILIWGAQLEQRSAVTAYTPTTTQPITNYVPVLQTAAAGVARFDHNPVTGESLGLLIEEQRTNLLTYSEQFDNAAWTKTRASIVANTVVAPDGTLSGDALIEDTTATNTHGVGRSISFVSGTTYTFSVFAKATTSSRFLQITFPSGAFTNTRRSAFDLVNGTVAPATDTTASIQSVGNGWYRCVSSMQATITASAVIQFQLADTYTNSSSTYTGDGYSGIYLWGAQLEAGAFPTSYIKTEASQVTRSADYPLMTGTNFSSWYRADEGTLFAEAANMPIAGATGSQKVSVACITNDVTNSVLNRLQLNNFASGASGNTATVSTNNVAQSSFSNFTFAATNKMVLTYKTNDLAATVNGAAVSTDASATIPPANAMLIGRTLNDSYMHNGHIRKIAYYPRRLSNTEIVSLTS